jgi:hypothetical protein
MAVCLTIKKFIGNLEEVPLVRSSLPQRMEMEYFTHPNSLPNFSNSLL